MTALRPAPPPSSPFAKISGNETEIIVAPKSRQKLPTEDDVASAHSSGGKSGISGARKGSKADTSRPAIFMRGVDRAVAREWFDEEEEIDENHGLKIWLDSSLIDSKDLSGFKWAWVSVVRPSGLQGTTEEDVEPVKPSLRAVAQLSPWEDAPDLRHVALSTQLCDLLDAHDMVGDTIRIEAAPPQVSKAAVRSLKVFPFAASTDKQQDGFRFGGKSKAENQEAAQRLLKMYSEHPSKILDGPITDGMMLLPFEEQREHSTWQGGILKFHPPPGPPLDAAKSTRGWLLGSDRRLLVGSSAETSKTGGSDRKLMLEVLGETIKPPSPASAWRVGQPLPSCRPDLVGIESLYDKLAGHLRHSSSTLLTGASGAGKTSIAQLLAHDIRESRLSHVTYFPCQLFATDESRISGIKETLGRVFALATWGARGGGNAVVILDDLDVLCPAESELEVGNEERNRHVSEIVRGIIQQHCSFGSKVVLLATAQNKEALHNIIVGGHVVQEMVHLPAPNKEMRRQVLETFVQRSSESKTQTKGNSDAANDIEYLDIAGRTDGYMPSDLLLLVSRAQSEALIRNVTSTYSSDMTDLMSPDFDAALKGLTPSSLRNVTLQHSTTSFSSVGGLRSTKQTLMETLQYPTLYAPIFARCPLRLRSGLLLYGYPGCGKTLLASAVAGECGLNFISVKGPEILNKYIGASEKSVRDLFERAQAARPCVLFFDEFDSVAPKRGHDSTGVTDRVVNQLLTQMDGAEGLSGVYVLAATSRPDLIDPALLRPGRLDKSIICAMPDFDDRMDILRALSGNLRVGESAMTNMRRVAKRTDGYTGADLQAVVYNAHLEAIHDVLGDRESHDKPQQNDNGAPMGGDSATKSVELPDFRYFRLGDDRHEKHGSASSSAYKASERAQIAQQLLTHRTAQKRLRSLRKGSTAHDHAAADGDQSNGETKKEPVIEWVHLERALAQTRPSISREEVSRLDKIYGEFVASRSGEMPSGQGGSEIGGRSSLM